MKKNLGRPRTVDHEKVFQQIQKGLTANEISLKMKISSALVYQIAKRNNVKTTVPQRREKIDWKLAIEEYLRVGNAAKVAKNYPISPGSITRNARKKGYIFSSIVGRPPLPGRTLEEMIDNNSLWKEIFLLFEGGKNQKEISQILKTSQPSVSFALRTMGFPIGKGNNNPRKKNLPKEEIIAYYQDGNSCKEIGKIFGVSGNVVLKRLNRWNIPRRVGKAVGIKNPQWKGGTKKAMHYYRRQAYEVVAICLGQPLQQGYVIHHVDENKENNDPNNLMIFHSLSLHTKFHQKVLSLQLKVDSKEAIQLALESGAEKLPKPPNPIEF